MSIHYNTQGERYEMDRDGTVYDTQDVGICDGCGDDLDDLSVYFQDHGWLCIGCQDDMEGEEEEGDDDD